MALRNLLGDTGATLVGVVLVGGQLGWSLCLVPVLLLTPWTQRPNAPTAPSVGIWKTLVVDGRRSSPSPFRGRARPTCQ